MNNPATPQTEIFDFLASPSTHGGAAVRRIDTHAASVFLVGDRALKVKRAVRFPFLDYSTIEKRKAACIAELEINRPLAPQIYRRVIAVTREHDGKLALDGNGEPVEWALEMRRFDESRTLDQLAQSGRIDAALAEALGRAVAAAHATAPMVDCQDWLKALAAILDQNDAELRARTKLFPASAVDELNRSSRAALARLQPLLLTRGKLGLTRRGHGDLHLANIVLIDQRPVLFDAIEFDPMIAAGDVFYDLAFLLMDLVERKLDQPANIVLNRYLAETGRLEDLDGLAALPLFMSMRAAIRAKVTAARLERADDATQRLEETAESARTYFKLACDLISPPAPVLIAIGGLSGTGKSVLARHLAPDIAPAPGAVILRSDIERKVLLNKGENERLPPDAYRPEFSSKTYESLNEKAERALAAGHSAIVDAVFADAEERAAVRQVARNHNIAFHGLFLVADQPTRLRRVGNRMHDASDADAAVVRRQESYKLGDMDWVLIDASGDPAETHAKARSALRAGNFDMGQYPGIGRR